jgi:WD40 repeat protein
MLLVMIWFLKQTDYKRIFSTTDATIASKSILMKTTLIRLFFLLQLLGFSACSRLDGTITPAGYVTSPAPTETATSTLVPSPSPTASPSPTPSATPLPTLTPTALLYAGQQTPVPPGLARITTVNAAQVSALAVWQENTVTDLAFSPDGQTLAVGVLDGTALYELPSRERSRFLESDEQVLKVAFSPDGSWFATGNRVGTEDAGFGGRVSLWRAPNWERLGPLYADPRVVSSVAFSPDGKTFAAAFASPQFEDDRIDFWDTRTWEISRTLQLGTVLNVAFSPNGSVIATVPDRYAIKVWRVKDGKLLDSLFTSFTGAVNCLEFSGDGNLLATGHYDGTIRLWDINTGQIFFEIGTPGVVESLAFSSDGKLLASGDNYADHAIRLWSVDTGELLRILEGHTHGVVSMAFSGDDRYMVSGAYNGTLRLWGIRP